MGGELIKLCQRLRCVQVLQVSITPRLVVGNNPSPYPR